MRPSDDSCKYHYLVPTNMFMVVSLRRVAEIVRAFFPASLALAEEAEQLAREIDDGIHAHAVHEMPGFGRIYAYEVDGCGARIRRSG